MPWKARDGEYPVRHPDTSHRWVFKVEGTAGEIYCEVQALSGDIPGSGGHSLLYRRENQECPPSWEGVSHAHNPQARTTGVPKEVLRRTRIGDRPPEPVRQAERLFASLRGEWRRAEAVPVVQAEEAGGVRKKVGT